VVRHASALANSNLQTGKPKLLMTLSLLPMVDGSSPSSSCWPVYAKIRFERLSFSFLRTKRRQSLNIVLVFDPCLIHQSRACRGCHFLILALTDARVGFLHGSWQQQPALTDTHDTLRGADAFTRSWPLIALTDSRVLPRILAWHLFHPIVYYEDTSK